MCDKEAFDYVERRNSLFQTVVTATISNRELIDGLAVEVQTPNFSEQELEYLCVTRQESYTEMEAVAKRFVELLSYQRNRLAYRKRTEIAVEIVRQIESEGQLPKADYAFDNGALTLDLTKLIESKNKYWVSEVECSRHINWEGQWRRVDEAHEELRQRHPESFRPVKARGRNGEERQYWAFTKVVRLKRYGRKRSERFKFADEKATVGQKVYTIAREAMAGVLQLAQGLFAQGRSYDQVLEVLMPA